MRSSCRATVVVRRGSSSLFINIVSLLFLIVVVGVKYSTIAAANVKGEDQVPTIQQQLFPSSSSARNDVQQQHQHQALVESLLAIVTSPSTRNISAETTSSLLAEDYLLTVYGPVRDGAIVFSGSYRGTKAWTLFFNQMIKVFDMKKYEFQQYTFLGVMNQSSSVIRLQDAHHTIYNNIKVSISEMIYFESDPISNLLTHTHILADTSQVAHVLLVDSGKTETEIFFVVGAGLIGILIGFGELIISLTFLVL